MSKEQALTNLLTALVDASEAGVLDDITWRNVQPDIVSRFCDAVVAYNDKWEARSYVNR